MWHDLKMPSGALIERTYLSDLYDSICNEFRMNIWPHYDVLLFFSSYFQHPLDAPAAIKDYRIPNYAYPTEGLKELIARCEAVKISKSFLHLLENRIHFLDSNR
jgi:hypothetical protein